MGVLLGEVGSRVLWEVGGKVLGEVGGRVVWEVCGRVLGEVGGGSWQEHVPGCENYLMSWLAWLWVGMFTEKKSFFLEKQRTSFY